MIFMLAEVLQTLHRRRLGNLRFGLLRLALGDLCQQTVAQGQKMEVVGRGGDFQQAFGFEVRPYCVSLG